MPFQSLIKTQRWQKYLPESLLHKHLLWLTDLLVVLTNKMVDPKQVHHSAFHLPGPDHQRWVQALLSDSLALLTTNTMLVRQDLAISTLRGQVPKETLWNLRALPLLRVLMSTCPGMTFRLCRRGTISAMFQVLRQAAQAQHPLPHKTSKSQGLAKPQGSFCAPASTQLAKPRSRSAGSVQLCGDTFQPASGDGVRH